jgi:predicted permease
MSMIDGLRHRLSVLFRGDSYRREQDAELRMYLELEAQQHAADGESVARRKLGNLDRVREDVRAASGLAWFDHIRQDVTYAFRGLRRSPGFTITVVLTLALGVGANAAMFSFLDRIFFRDPPGVSQTADLRRIYREIPEGLGGPGDRAAVAWFTHPQFVAIQNALAGTIDIAADIPPGRHIGRREGDPHVAFVTANYLSILGVQAAAGRFFGVDESRIDVDPGYAVITHSFWRRRFGLDRNVAGKEIEFFGKRYTVIGVTAEGFDGIDVATVEVFLPLSAFPVVGDGRPWYKADDDWSPLRPIMRVRSGQNGRVLLASATNAFRAAGQTDSSSLLIDGPLIEAQGPGGVIKEISVSTRMAGVTLLVLIIACANVASLLLVRASQRRREIAVRLALGVSKARLLSQLLTESVALALLGSFWALAIAYAGGTLLRSMLLPEIVWARGALEPRIVFFTIGSAIVCGFAAGLAPVVQSLQTDFASALKAGARDGTRRSVLRSALLASQGALSVVLLIGASLFVRTYDNVRSMPLGFDAARMIWARVTAADSLEPRVTVALTEVASRMASVPGVAGATTASNIQMAGMRSTELYVPGQDTVGRGSARVDVGSTYFATTGMTFIAGRPFTPDELSNHIAVAVVSRSLEQKLFRGESAIGKCIALERRTAPCTYIVGVTANARAYTIFEAQENNQVFLPASGAAGHRLTSLIINADPRHADEIAERIRDELRQALPGADRIYVRRTAVQIEPQYRPWKVGAEIFSAFGVLALIVAAIGVYAVVSYSVSQRTQEMGVRIALGARVRDVLNLIVGEGMRVVAVGIAGGVIIALALSRLVASYLFGVTTHDPFVIIGAASVLTGAGLVASLIPAWRAARVDPITSLRSD